MSYLLDTNILSEPLKKHPDANIMAQLEDHQSELLTATPVWHELWFGCLRLPPSARRTRIEDYLSGVLEASVARLPYDDQAARWHSLEGARLQAAGQTPSLVDAQIAAIAATNRLTLVTKNVCDFQAFTDLKVNDWSKPPE